LATVARLEAKGVSLGVLSMSGNYRYECRQVDAERDCRRRAGRAEGMLERQREGIAKAEARRRYKGHVPTAWRQAAEIVRLREAGISPSEIALRSEVIRASVYRVLAEQNGRDRAAA
jgi:Helix-turn-helix domain of resolvase